MANVGYHIEISVRVRQFRAFQAHFDAVIFLRSEICRFFSIRKAQLAKKHFFMLYAGKKYQETNLGIIPIFGESVVMFWVVSHGKKCAFWIK